MSVRPLPLLLSFSQVFRHVPFASFLRFQDSTPRVRALVACCGQKDERRGGKRDGGCGVSYPKSFPENPHWNAIERWASYATRATVSNWLQLPGTTILLHLATWNHVKCISAVYTEEKCLRGQSYVSLYQYESMQGSKFSWGSCCLLSSRGEVCKSQNALSPRNLKRRVHKGWCSRFHLCLQRSLIWTSGQGTLLGAR